MDAQIIPTVIGLIALAKTLFPKVVHDQVTIVLAAILGGALGYVIGGPTAFGAGMASGLAAVGVVTGLKSVGTAK